MNKNNDYHFLKITKAACTSRTHALAFCGRFHPQRTDMTAPKDPGGIAPSAAGCIAHGAATVITERLSDLPDLALPSSLYKDAAHPPSTAVILAYLQALLKKDPAAFLARYGGLLQSQELNHFEVLRSSDYEVDHWLRHFATQSMDAADSAASPSRLPARVKNRRLAAMRRLAAEGEYFSYEAMRQRAPLLYHQHIGEYVTGEGAGAGTSEQEDPEKPEGSGRQQAAGEGAHCTAQAPGGAAGAGGGLGGSCLAGALQAAFARWEGGPPWPSHNSQEDSAVSGASALVPGGASAQADPQSITEPSGARTSTLDPPAGTHMDISPAASPEATNGEERQLNIQVDGEGQQSLAGSSGTAAGGGKGRVVDENSGVCVGGSREATRWAGVAPHATSVAALGNRPGGAGGGPGELLFSEFLIRQDYEAQLLMRRIQEQEEEDAQMSEHDSDESDDDVDDDAGNHMSDDAGGMRRRPRAPPSIADLAQMRRNFVLEMESRFLQGQDGQHVDYVAIDADASLDADWIEQESRDAEEKYFDED